MRMLHPAVLQIAGHVVWLLWCAAREEAALQTPKQCSARCPQRAGG